MTTSTTLPAAPSRRVRLQRRRALAVAAIVLLLAATLFGLWRWRAAAFPVQLVVDGEPVTVWTRAESPEALLAGLGYALRPEDALQVEGTWGPDARVALQRARPLHVEVDGETRIVWTRAQRVEEALAEAGVSLAPGDAVWLDGVAIPAEAPLPAPHWRPPAPRRTAPPWQMVPQPLTLTIRRAVPIQVIDEGGVTRTLWTQAETVGEALTEHDVAVAPGDVVLPGLESAIEPGMRVFLRRATPLTLFVDGQRLELRTQGYGLGWDGR
jgi:uncharacterized protein YabE (DUF348 family)